MIYVFILYWIVSAGVEEIDEANKFYFRELESHERAHVSYMAFRAGAYWRAHWKQKEQK